MPPSSHSRYVSRLRLLRFVLPLLLMLCLGLLFLWPYVETVWQKPEEMPQHPSLTLDSLKDNRLMAPHYQAFDPEGRPYTVGASWAIQQDKNAVSLHNPYGAITLPNAETFTLTAQQGLYEHDDKALNLNGQVTVLSNRHQKLLTDAVSVDLKAKKIESHSPVTGQSFAGTLQAEKGFEMNFEKDHKKLILKGKSQVTFYPQRVKQGKPL